MVGFLRASSVVEASRRCGVWIESYTSRWDYRSCAGFSPSARLCSRRPSGHLRHEHDSNASRRRRLMTLKYVVSPREPSVPAVALSPSRVVALDVPLPQMRITLRRGGGLRCPSPLRSLCSPVRGLDLVLFSCPVPRLILRLALVEADQA